MILDSLIESSRLMYGIKWPIFKRVLIYLLLMLFLSPIIFTVVFSMKLLPGEPMVFRLALFTLMQIPFFIIMIQIIMMGVRQAIRLPISLKKINAQCLAVKWKLAQLIIILIVINDLREYFTPIPRGDFIYGEDMLKVFVFFLIVWAVSIPIVIFAIPLLVIKKQSLTHVLASAYNKATLNWKKIIISYGILSLPVLLVGLSIFLRMHSVITIGFMIIALLLTIWILPMGVTLGGVLFRDAYQLKKRDKHLA